MRRLGIAARAIARMRWLGIAARDRPHAPARHRCTRDRPHALARRRGFCEAHARATSPLGRAAIR
jgi:hypothetical protein